MPDGPIGTRKMRVQKALYWYWTRDLTQEEIGEKLGVSARKVREYISEAPTSPAIQERVDDLEVQVRYAAAEKLRDQLKTAGVRAETAEKPVKVWTDSSGQLNVKDEHNDVGELTGRYIIPDTFELGPDEQARFYGRSEVREILDLLTDIVGAKAAERQEIEHSGNIDVDANHTVELDAETAAKIRDADLGDH